MTKTWLDEIRWTDEGLVAAIAQDAETGKILMFAWMNRKSLALTVNEGYAVYWSRSRNKLWRKGEESGHRQKNCWHLSRLRRRCYFVDGRTDWRDRLSYGERKLFLPAIIGRQMANSRTRLKKSQNDLQKP